MGYAVDVLWTRACWFIAMEIGVSSIPVSEVRTLSFLAQVMAGSRPFTLVLLRRTLVHWGELYSLFFLQRFRHLEGRRRALAEPQEVLGLEMHDRRIEDVVSCVHKKVHWSA